MVDPMEDVAAVDREQLRSSHTRAPEVYAEVLPGPERRRRWSTEEKLRILAQSLAPGSSVSLVCRLHGISSGQLYTWRRLFRSGELTGFAPVAVIADSPVPQLPPPEPVADPVPPPETTAPPSAATIEVELPTGVKLRLNGDVDEAALRRVLSALS